MEMPAGRTLIVTAGIVVAILTGCDPVSSIITGESNPMTPDQSKAQVIEPANEIVAALGLPVVNAFFRPDSCSDDNKGPFRGKVSTWYPLAPSYEGSESEIARMVQRLQGLGWTGNSDFRSHGTVLKKNNVDAVVRPQSVSVPNRVIELYGECRDVTTTKGQRGTHHLGLTIERVSGSKRNRSVGSTSSARRPWPPLDSVTAAAMAARVNGVLGSRCVRRASAAVASDPGARSSATPPSPQPCSTASCTAQWPSTSTASPTDYETTTPKPTLRCATTGTRVFCA